jgi:KDO2-lipid IV(A) lauroyltransferase
MEKIPRPWAYALAIVVARAAYLLASKARRCLEFNLGMALPEASDQEIARLVRLNFRNHAKAYADLMRMPRARVEDLQPLLKLEGMEHLEAARAADKGVLVISAHMGSWEVTAAIWAATIAPVSLFAEELEPQEMYDWYRTTRARLGISVLPLRRSGLRQVLKALESNEMVVTAVDRDMLGTGMLVDFFGRPARIPTGPASIALRTGAAILPVCVYRLPDDTYQAEGSSPVHVEASGDRAADERRINEQLVRHMEQIIRAHPEQWHMPHPIWESTP